MSKATVLTIHTDGASRGNPGPAAFAYTIRGDGFPGIEECGLLGEKTNNQAEYAALVRALEHAAGLGTGYPLIIHSDSELMVKQMNGEYRVKDDSLRELYDEARALRARFGSVQIRHVRREQNKDADRLCNEALDGKSSGGPRLTAKKSAQAEKKPACSSRHDWVREEAVACLTVAAQAWARGGAGAPTPEQVWDQLWSVLQEHRVLR